MANCSDNPIPRNTFTEFVKTIEHQEKTECINLPPKESIGAISKLGDYSESFVGKRNRKCLIY